MNELTHPKHNFDSLFVWQTVIENGKLTFTVPYPTSDLLHNGCVPWVDPAVLTQVSPRQELIERSHSPSRGDGMHLRSPLNDILHKQGTGGLTRWAPSKLFDCTGADRGLPREAKRTHPTWGALTPNPVCHFGSRNIHKDNQKWWFI